ncbi:TonB-dependent receptor [Aliidiomarina iranensis]|nr:TonB-dependent receptor [Aliidiomarina iranensis]
MPFFYRISPLTLAILFSFPAAADNIEVIEVRGENHKHSEDIGAVDRLLREQGVDFSSAGGVSALPVMRGLMGDRIKVLIDGTDITASCANQMNPPLSYVSANQVQTAQVVAGVAPVSMGGDNIAGVIRLNTIAPEFTDSSQLSWRSGGISAEYRSNSDAQVYAADARIANDWLSFSYSGSFEDAKSYEDGNGERVLDTLYRAENHAITAAVKDDEQQLAVKLTYQAIPFQGYPNQYMDMTNNESFGATAIYQTAMGNSDFSAQIHWQHVQHQMGFFTDEKPGMMPMDTEADDYSYQLRWEIPLASDHQLRVGHEFFDYRLEDWWPAVNGSAMMGPNDYINISDGKRQRITGYLESERAWSSQWLTSTGIRVERVQTNAGEVQPYNRMPGMMGMPNLDAAAADDFNNANRKQSDILIDVSLLTTYAFNDQHTLSIGMARKNRAPNLYERYSWGRSPMATTMIGWYGDGNGYVGRIDLEPETAHTFSLSYRFLAENGLWDIELAPYYTRVSDYIDAEVIGEINRSNEPAGERNVLQFTNVDANLYGFDAYANARVMESGRFGDWFMQGKLSLTEGERHRSNEALYQIKPITASFSLLQQWQNFENTLSYEWVGEKDDVDTRRLENTTASYGLVNLSSRWRGDNISVGLSVLNLFDKYYEEPLGGVSIAEFKANNAAGFRQLAGAGRSVNLAVSYVF